MPPSDKVTIGGKEYTITKLKCKHLRRMDEMLKQAKEERLSGEAPGLFKNLSRWMPFIIESIQVNHKDFNQEAMDEMTMQELMDTWTAITTLSAIQFTTGEAPPVEQTGASSTAASAVPSAGPIVM